MISSSAIDHLIIKIKILPLLEKIGSCPPGFTHAPSWLLCKTRKGVCCIVSDDCCGDCAKNRCNGVGGDWIQMQVKSKSACKSPGACHIGKSIYLTLSNRGISVFKIYVLCLPAADTLFKFYRLHVQKNELYGDE